MVALIGLACFALGFIFRGCFETIKPNLDNELMSRLIRYVDKVQSMSVQGRTRSRRPDVPDIDFESVQSSSPMENIYREN